MGQQEALSRRTSGFALGLVMTAVTLLGCSLEPQEVELTVEGADPILLIHDLDPDRGGVGPALIGQLSYKADSKCLLVSSSDRIPVVPAWPSGTIAIEREGQFRIGIRGGRAVFEGERISEGGSEGDPDLLSPLNLPAGCFPEEYRLFFID